MEDRDNGQHYQPTHTSLAGLTASPSPPQTALSPASNPALWPGRGGGGGGVEEIVEMFCRDASIGQ